MRAVCSDFGGSVVQCRRRNGTQTHTKNIRAIKSNMDDTLCILDGWKYTETPDNLDGADADAGLELLYYWCEQNSYAAWPSCANSVQTAVYDTQTTRQICKWIEFCVGTYCIVYGTTNDKKKKKDKKKAVKRTRWDERQRNAIIILFTQRTQRTLCDTCWFGFDLVCNGP